MVVQLCAYKSDECESRTVYKSGQHFISKKGVNVNKRKVDAKTRDIIDINVFKRINPLSWPIYNECILVVGCIRGI